MFNKVKQGRHFFLFVFGIFCLSSTASIASDLNTSLRGSLEGEFGAAAWSVSDLSKGSFTLPLGLSFPEERGSCIYPLHPQYTPSQGISEWGMGISFAHSIRRFRSTGALDFQTDDLVSPWGQLVRGQDGDYYPAGVHTPIRVRWVSEREFRAYLPDGTLLTFGRESVLNTPSGGYAWYLVEAKNNKNQVARFRYAKSEENYFYLMEILYGGSGSDFQYRILLDYEDVKAPFLDYRSTILQKLTQRVKTVRFSARASGGSSAFVDRHQYQFEYEEVKRSSAFFLKSIQKHFELGGSEPKKTFTYAENSSSASGLSPGLMRSVDDGKGNRLVFEYAPVKLHKAMGSRLVVLSGLLIQSAGIGEQGFRYRYDQAQAHPLSKSLLGFNRVWIEQPYSKLEFHFYHDEGTPTLALGYEASDFRQPHLSRIQKKEVEKAVFQGIPFYRIKKESEGWVDTQSNQSSLMTREVSEYESDFCPSFITKSFLESKLTIQTHYQKPLQLETHLSCFAKNIHFTGTHLDPTFDFHQEWTIETDPLGNPTRLFTPANGGRILGDIGYREDYRIRSIAVPGKGSTFFDYDPLYRVTQVTLPNASQVRVQYDPLGFDLVDTVSALHGQKASGLFQQGFAYDELQRVNNYWNNIFASSIENPLERHAYQHPGEDRPGVVTTFKKFLQGTQTIFKVQGLLHSADGKAMGLASQNESGWVLNGLTYTIPDAHRVQVFPSKVIKDAPQNLRVLDLLNGSEPLFEETQSSLTLPLQQKVTYQRDVSGMVETQSAVDSDQLVLSHSENQSFRTIEYLKNNNQQNKTIHQNPEGQKTAYQYDALGRLVVVTLPGGQNHRVHYDAQGRVEMITRSNLGKILFSYYPGTDLIRSKQFFGDVGRQAQERSNPITPGLKSGVRECWDGVLNPVPFPQVSLCSMIRSVEFSYDAAGRMTQQIQKTPTVSRRYSYYYDGKLPSGKLIDGQVGFLTAVQSPDFIRTQIYRSDGKLAQVQVEVPQWKTLTQTFEYQPDGSVRSQTTQLRNHPGRLVEKPIEVAQSFEVDSFGRVSEIRLNEHTSLARLHYGPFSLVHQAVMGDGTEFSYSYDPTTYALQGFSTKKQGLSPRAENSWQLNDRGLIKSEIFSLMPQLITPGLNFSSSMKKQYFYSKNASLLGELDSRARREYQYDENELLAEFRTASGQTSIESAPSQWLVKNSQGGIAYVLDSFGRLIRTSKATLIYGPSGRVERLDTHGKRITYYYDETGRRIFKREGGEITEAYFGGLVVTENEILQPVLIQGLIVGVLKNSEYVPLSTDFRGSVLENSVGQLSVSSSYGEKKVSQKTDYSNLIDYVARGYDPDLKAYRMQQRDYDPYLKRFHTPDPLILENPDLCLERPKECNLYGYAAGNPVSLVDPEGLLTVIVHGTWDRNATWAQPGSDFHGAVSSTFREQALPFNWSGGNSIGARSEAAQGFAKWVRGRLNPGESLNVVAHSHGGNVIKEYTNISGAVKIDTLVNIATPQRTDYQINSSMVRNYFNVYSPKDLVQVNGGGFSGRSGRLDTAAINIKTLFGYDRSDSSLGSLIEGRLLHSSVISSDVWQKFVAPWLNK